MVWNIDRKLVILKKELINGFPNVYENIELSFWVYLLKCVRPKMVAHGVSSKHRYIDDR